MQILEFAMHLQERGLLCGEGFPDNFRLLRRILHLPVVVRLCTDQPFVGSLKGLGGSLDLLPELPVGTLLVDHSGIRDHGSSLRSGCNS